MFPTHSPPSNVAFKRVLIMQAMKESCFFQFFPTLKRREGPLSQQMCLGQQVGLPLKTNIMTKLNAIYRLLTRPLTPNNKIQERSQISFCTDRRQTQKLEQHCRHTLIIDSRSETVEQHKETKHLTSFHHTLDTFSITDP